MIDDPHDRRGSVACGRITCAGIVTALTACWRFECGVADGYDENQLLRYRFPPEIIDQAIWLYLRFTLTAVRQELCLNGRTTLILLVSRVSRLTWRRKGINAVRHTNSVFHDILKLVPWAAFDRLVDDYGTDEAARRFTTRNQFLALLSPSSAALRRCAKSKP